MNTEPVDHLVWSGMHGAWYRPDERGYTVRLAEAGWYTRRRAQEIEELSRPRGNERSRAVPVGALVRMALEMQQLPHSLDQLRVEALDWQAEQFPKRTVHSINTHLSREALELAMNPYDAEELADVFLLLVALANEVQVDLAAAVAAKLSKNKARRWGTPDADGVVEHLP